MTPRQVRPEQIQEFYAQRIFGAAAGLLAVEQEERLETNGGGRGGEEMLLESGSESNLMRHSRSVAAEMPPILDGAYVLRLQSQLALARYSMDRMAAATADSDDAMSMLEEVENNPAVSRTTAMQLASAASRLRRHDAQMQAEATRSLGLVAELQVDLARTRERMSDALSVARSTHTSTSRRSFSFEAGPELLDDAANADRNSDAASLDPAVLSSMDDFVVGPLELDLNDIEPEVNHQQGDERNTNDNAELLASVAGLRFDLLQTRERLMDERSFSRSSNHLEDLIPSLEEATPEASESTIMSTSAEHQPKEEEQQSTTNAAETDEPSQEESELNDATARLASLSTATAPKASGGDSSVRGARIRSEGDLVFRRFSNQMA